MLFTPVTFVVLSLIGVSLSDENRRRVLCYSCVSFRLARDERALPADTLRAVPKATDTCDQHTFDRDEVDLRYCPSVCAAAAVWDRGMHGTSRPPIGYVRACLTDFVRFDMWRDSLTAGGCHRMRVTDLAPSRRLIRNLVSKEDRIVNMCTCNATLCNNHMLRATAHHTNSARFTPVLFVMILLGFFRVRL